MKKNIFYTIKSGQEFCRTFSWRFREVFFSLAMTFIHRLSILLLNCWRKSLMLPFLLGIILMTTNTINAQNILGRAPVQAPKGGFAIDGNAFVKFPGPPSPADNPTWGDFLFEAGYTETDPSLYTAKTPGGIFVPVPPAYNYPDGPLPSQFYVYPNTTFYRDNITTSDPTTFTSSNKIDDAVSSYTWGVGSSPDKNEIQNAIAHFTFGDAALGGNPDDLWLVFAADRQVTNGSSYIDFEILQKKLMMTVTGTDSKGFNFGTFTSEAGTPSGRTVGDILITIEFTQGGVSANVVIRKWDGTVYNVIPPPAGLVYGTNNTTQTVVPYPVYNQAPISTNPNVWAYAPNQWAEGAVNITQIFGIGNTNPCFTVSTLFVRTRTSGSSGQSELKDFPGAPFQLNLNLTPTATAVATASPCFGGNGSVDLTVVGGVAPFTYAWTASNGGSIPAGQEDDEDLTSVPIGTYSVTVTDKKGCSATAQATVTQPSIVTLSASHTNVSCNGLADGKLSIDSFSGTGTPSFYLKKDAGAFVATTEAAIEAAVYGPGTYVIKVTYPDGNNPPGSGVCEKTETETITQPDAVTLSASHMNVSCNGAADGKLSVDSFSGTGTPTFYLKIGAGAFVATTEAAIEAANYGPETYVIKVTYPDGNNPPGSGVCEKTETETIIQPDAVTLSASHTNVSCNGAANGKLSIDSFSGTGTASFYLKTGAGAFVATTEAAIEAATYGPNTYVIKVTYPDGNNPPSSGVCEKTETETISEPPALSCSLTQPAIVNCSTSGNTVSGTVSGGTSAYSCSASFDAAGTAAGWSASCNIVGNAITVTYTAGSVASTVLTVEITDANGCKSTCSLTLSCNGGKACTPGFWKNHAEVWNAQNDFVVNNMPGTLTNPVTKGGTFITTSSFYAYFNIPVTKDISNKAGLTMLDVTALGGGGCKALARHGVSALLGAAAFPAEYPFPAGSTDFASLYTLIRNAFLNGNCDALAATLANINNLDGPFCSALSQLAQVEQLAITTTSTIASFDAYPVPFKDQFTIKYNFDYKSDVKIEVFNSQGALVFTMNDTDSYLNKEVIIKIDSVLEQQQVYVVKLTTRKGSSTKTIMSSSE
jgi:uncharacterized protein YijF (DUF1287 family)